MKQRIISYKYKVDILLLTNYDQFIKKIKQKKYLIFIQQIQHQKRKTAHQRLKDNKLYNLARGN